MADLPPTNRRTRSPRQQQVTAVGFTVKSGWAAAVLIAGSGTSPRVVDSLRIDLSDPRVPQAHQPYHDGFGTARGKGPGLRRLVASVRQFGRNSIDAALRAWSKAGHRPAGAGVVVGSLIDPDRIANAHIRIHALEGQLFRDVVQSAVRRHGLRCSTWRARDLPATAAAALGRPEARLRTAVAQLRHGASGSWRAEEKAAALAAWLVLAQRTSSVKAARPPRSSGTTR